MGGAPPPPLISYEKTKLKKQNSALTLEVDAEIFV